MALPQSGAWSCPPGDFGDFGLQVKKGMNRSQLPYAKGSWAMRPWRKMFKNIVVAVDGSDHAIHAAKMAGDLARTMKSENLWIVMAYDPIPTYLGEPNIQNAITARLEAAEFVIQTMIKAVGKIPGEVRKEILEGSAAEEIIKVAEISRVRSDHYGFAWLGKVDRTRTRQPESKSGKSCTLPRTHRSVTSRR